MTALGRIAAGLALCALASAHAYADPPPKGTADYDLLMPWADAIARAIVPGMGVKCCSVAEGTVVDARMVGNHWQIRFRDRARFHDVPMGWVDVPDEAVLRDWANPVGAPVVWWYHRYVGGGLDHEEGYVRCFGPEELF